MSELGILCQLRRDATTIFRAGLHAVDAEEAVRRHVQIDVPAYRLHLSSGESLSLSQFKRAFAVGAGKAAAPMAFALEQLIAPVFEPQGIINVKYGHTSPRPRFIDLHEAGHPLPDSSGVEGTRRIEQLVGGLADTDLLFVLISGGASALLAAPAEGISLEEKQQTTDLLLRSGADIYELNAVRKHLSSLKGGQLALRARPATVVSLILSDVIGDRLDVIGSGLTSYDPSTFEDAERVLRKYNLLERVPASVRDRLREGCNGHIPETPKSINTFSDGVYNLIVGSNRLAIEAAADAARSLGYNTAILSSTLQGETRVVARAHAEILREVISSGNPVQRPACLLSGGETTVSVRGSGTGGRNQEFSLAAALAVSGLRNTVVLAAGTDGTDGPTDAAGAVVDGTTAARAGARGFSLIDHLDRNDAYPLLDAVDDLLRTGSTGTNVMDLNIMLAGEDCR
jgi:hydroxypyruvate reductase